MRQHIRESLFVGFVILALTACVVQSGLAVETKRHRDAGVSQDAGTFTSTATGMAQWTVKFSPTGGCTQLVVGAIGTATAAVHVMDYEFTSDPILQAILNLQKSGKKVYVILDKTDLVGAGKPITDALKAAKIPTWIDRKHAIFHNKVTIVDHSAVETGSFNYTTSAESRNAENCILLQDPQLAKVYQADWNYHVSHSTPLQ